MFAVLFEGYLPKRMLIRSFGGVAKKIRDNTQIKGIES